MIKRRSFLITGLCLLSGCSLNKKKWIEEKKIAQLIIDKVRDGNANTKDIKVYPICFVVNGLVNKSESIYFSSLKNNISECLKNQYSFTYPCVYGMFNTKGLDIEKIKEFVKCLG